MFHQLYKHLEFRQNAPLRVIFSTLFLVFGYPDETLSPVFDIFHHTVIIRLLLDWNITLCEVSSLYKDCYYYYYINRDHSTGSLTSLALLCS